MATEIKIKGIQEPMIADDASEIKRKWESYKIGRGKNEMIEIAGWEGTLADISWLKSINKTNANNIHSEEINREYLASRERILKLLPDIKAKNMGFFRLVYWGFTGQKSEEVKTKSGRPIEELAEELQLKFFQENQNRMFCDPIVYKPLIRSNRCNPAVMAMIERQIYTDKSFAKK